MTSFRSRLLAAAATAMALGTPVQAAEPVRTAPVATPTASTQEFIALGVARLRQGRPAEARDLLLRASANPAEAGRWAPLLEEASFWAELSEGRRLMALGQQEAAGLLLARAVRRDTSGRAEAEALLGRLELARGDAREAEARFRAANYRRPGLGAVREGLLDSLRRQGRIAEADALLREPEAPLRADALRQEADRTEEPEAALALLRGALAATAEGSPANAWARLDLARSLARQGRTSEAREVMAAGPTARPELLQAAALFAGEDGRPVEGIRLLERLPDRLRSADQASLLRSLRLQVDVAAAMVRPPAEARAALLAIAGRADGGGEAGLRALRALLRLEQRDALEEATRLALEASRAGAAALRVALAEALADAGLSGEAAAMVRPLMAAEGVETARRRRLAGLAEPSLAIRQEAPGPVATQAEAPHPFHASRDPRVAARVAEAVLRRDPRNAGARMGAVEAAVALEDLPAAEALLAEGRVLHGSDPRLSVAEARLARAQGDGRRAQAALLLAADQRRAQIAPAGAAAGARPAGRRTMLAGDGQGSSFEPLDANPAGAAAGGVTPTQLRASDDPLLAEIGRQLAEVNELAAGRAVPSLAFRSRSGSNGLDRLREHGGGAEAAMPLPGLGGELSARVQAVNIDAGRLDSGLSNLRRFGTNPVLLPGSAGFLADAQATALRPRDQSVTGTAIGAAYARSGVTVDLGSTPLGFREQRLLGGIEFTPRISENIQLRLRGERRSVTDSLLSWSGTRDSASGTVFGGVTRTTGRAQVEYSANQISAYAGGGYSSITGRNVADNNRLEASAGIGYAVMRSPTRELTTGLDLSYYAYDRNLRNFTFGQGGYFSPQTYINASVPVDYRERLGNFAYHVGASLGVANFREKSSPVFPTDPGLQSTLDQQAASDTSIATRYGSQRSTTLTAGLRADVEYALTPVLRIGATARYDRSADFNETRALVYARYRFDP